MKSPARFDGKAMHMIGVEIEISFHIVRDIAARSKAVGRDEALAAVGDAFVGMEVVDTRLANFKQVDPEWLLADNQMNHALVMGDSVKELDGPRLGRPAGEAGRSTASTIVDQRGGLGAVDPVRPLAWMIDHAVPPRRHPQRPRRSPPARGPACAISRPARAPAASSPDWARSKRRSESTASHEAPPAQGVIQPRGGGAGRSRAGRPCRCSRGRRRR